MLDPNEGPVLSMPVAVKHGLQQERIAKARDLFERSPFNTYEGPDRPEVLIVTSSACTLYSREAIQALNPPGPGRASEAGNDLAPAAEPAEKIPRTVGQDPDRGGGADLPGGER